MSVVDTLAREAQARQLRSKAWREVLRSEAGRQVLADILARTYHWSAVSDPEHRTLQQFGIELLRESGVYKPTGSFPVDYVSLLTDTKLGEPAPEPMVGRRQLFGRLFARKSN